MSAVASLLWLKCLRVTSPAKLESQLDLDAHQSLSKDGFYLNYHGSPVQTMSHAHAFLHTLCPWSPTTFTWRTRTRPGQRSFTVAHSRIIQQYGDRYTGRWWVGCCIWYSDEGPARAADPPSPLLAVRNVTAHPSMASVPTWHYYCLCTLKG